MKLLKMVVFLPFLLVAAGCGGEEGSLAFEVDELLFDAQPSEIPPESAIYRPAPGAFSLSGSAYRFDWTFDMLKSAKISVLERPDLPAVSTDVNGDFTFDGFHDGDEVTIVSHHPDFYPTQSATLILEGENIDDITLQVPPKPIVWGLSLVLLEWLDPGCCQIATTVTVPGGTPFSPGIAGAEVFIDPPLPPENGPFYFEIIEIPGWPMLDIPRRHLTQTTGDGGAVFVNVPPGEYVLTAELDGNELTSAFIKCRAGVLVNASPPYGMHPIQ